MKPLIQLSCILPTILFCGGCGQDPSGYDVLDWLSKDYMESKGSWVPTDDQINHAIDKYKLHLFEDNNSRQHF